jgi:hypothetical protein
MKVLKKKDNTDIKLSWSSLDEGLSVLDKLHIFEEYYTKGNLTESNNQDTKNYFVSLFKLSDKPTKNKKYIVVPLSLVGDRILPLDKPGYMEYLGKSMDTQLVFKSVRGEVRYPSETIRNLAIYKTFTFQTQEAYDKFRTALTLKFDTDLPSIKLTKMEEDLDANQKRVGQLGPTEPIGKDGGVGKLVGVSESNTLESIMSLDGIQRLVKKTAALTYTES